MPTVTAQGEPELVDLRLHAEQLAGERRERLTSAHLLVAMSDQGAVAGELLAERRLSRETLLQAARSSTDDEVDPVRAAVERARQVAKSLRAPHPTALHLLVALLKVRQCAAFRALDQCGVDVHRLRAAAMNAALGELGRVEPRQSRQQSAVVARTPLRRHAGKAVSVPLMKMPVRPAQADVSAAKSEQPSPPAQTPQLTRPVSNPQKAEVPRKQRRRKSAFGLDSKRFPVLSKLGRNLCVLVEREELSPIVGRDLEVEKVLDVLAKREANNPCLVGLPGVGKSAVIRGLAHRIVSGEDMAEADRHILIELSVSDLLAGAAVRGALSQRLAAIKKEVLAADGRIVIVFDDVHQIAGAESTEELVGELRRGLSQGQLRCLGATTPDDYARVIERDPTLNRFFSRIDVEEPDLEVACAVLEASVPGYRQHHDVEIDDEALTYAVAWSARYVSDSALPDKALSIVDLAAARASRRGLTVVGKEQIASVVSELSSVPTDRLLESDGERMLRLEQTLADRVVGHGEQLSCIADILRRNAAGLGGQRPIGTFLLLGPTGVGKTETAKAIAATLFGSEQAMTRLDLSEYSEAHAVARLIGAPPGYVGHEAGGQLTEAVRRRPYQVLLLDELEKAHQEVLETFLPLFDEGRLTDGQGRTVDFSNTVIILTSNIGANIGSGAVNRRVGFGVKETHGGGITEATVAEARRRLSPEFFNRLDEVLVFGALEQRDVEEIARRLLQQLADLVYEQRDIELCIEPSVVGLLLDRGGFDATLGARPMKRAIARLIEAPLAQALLSGDIAAGEQVKVVAVGGRVVFETPSTVAAE